MFTWLKRCCCCGDSAKRRLPLCNICETLLPKLEAGCWRCALPLTDANLRICGRCLKQPPPFAAAHALFQYTHPIDLFLIALKFHKKLLYANLFGTLLAQHLQSLPRTLPWPECLIPVPLHTTRLQQRGYNQALEIAKPLSRILKIPIQMQLCTRFKATRAQSDLPQSLRTRNVANAFSITRAIPFKHIAIVDDAMTTSATVTALANVLIQQGVQCVEVWCVARTLLT